MLYIYIYIDICYTKGLTARSKFDLQILCWQRKRMWIKLLAEYCPKILS